MRTYRLPAIILLYRAAIAAAVVQFAAPVRHVRVVVADRSGSNQRGVGRRIAQVTLTPPPTGKPDLPPTATQPTGPPWRLFAPMVGR